MNNLQEASERICWLKGETLGMETLLISILRALPPQQLANTLREFDQEAEAARVSMLNNDQAGDHVLRGFDAYVQRVSAIRR